MDTVSLQTLASHFTKEIELATQLIIEQRTKNNLIVALGPFLILGAIAASSRAIDIISEFPRKTLVLLSLFLLLSYATLGYLSAQVELNIWIQANRWRTELSTLYGMDKDAFIYSPDGLTATYIGIYLAIGMAFLSIFFLIVGIKQRKKA